MSGLHRMCTATVRSAVTALAVAGSAVPAQAPDAAPSRAALTAALLVRADGAQADRRALAALDRLGAHADTVAGDGIALRGGAAEPVRGRLQGPAYLLGWIDPGGAVELQQLFLSGQLATISVAAMFDQPVRLSLAGRGSPGACAADGRNCHWIPPFTERYTITVRNQGSRRTKFYLVVD